MMVHENLDLSRVQHEVPFLFRLPVQRAQRWSLSATSTGTQWGRLRSKSCDMMFNNASGIQIQGGTFINNNSPTNRTPRGMDLLMERVATGAFHDSDGLYDTPKCHPRTRVAVLDDIMRWVRQSRSAQEEFMMWLFGPANACPNWRIVSAIQQSPIITHQQLSKYAICDEKVDWKATRQFLRQRLDQCCSNVHRRGSRDIAIRGRSAQGLVIEFLISHSLTKNVIAA